MQTDFSLVMRTSLRNGSIHLVPRARGMYDRLVADVFVNEQNVADTLIAEGHRKPCGIGLNDDESDGLNF